MIEDLRARFGIVGRTRELEDLLACVQSHRHVLLEGPVGVGKTALARAVAEGLGRPWYRVDGDGRYSEGKLVGQFDPPIVLERGYIAEAFRAGPLVRAMETGGVLFVNELNRMPEGVQNVLLPSMDEGRVEIPMLGTVLAKEGFVVVATQNPAEFVATSHLAEALLDRFELVVVDYPPEAEEREIVRLRARVTVPEGLIERAVAITRATRSHPHVQRGASIRAGIAIAELAVALGDFDRAVALALPTRIELVDERDTPMAQVLAELKKKATGSSPA